MQTSKFELIEAFMAMNEETRLDILREKLDSFAYEEQVRTLSKQESALKKKAIR